MEKPAMISAEDQNWRRVETSEEEKKFCTLTSTFPMHFFRNVSVNPHRRNPKLIWMNGMDLVYIIFSISFRLGFSKILLKGVPLIPSSHRRAP
jgi:hypothetical protein